MSLDEKMQTTVTAKKELNVKQQEALKNVIEWAKEFVKRVKENIMKAVESLLKAFSKYFKPHIMILLENKNVAKRISYRQSIRSHIEKKGKNRISITNLRPTT